ncbi:MAG: hypothetical protein U0Z44_09095 [Kouleothrix sp.]
MIRLIARLEDILANPRKVRADRADFVPKEIWRRAPHPDHPDAHGGQRRRPTIPDVKVLVTLTSVAISSQQPAPTPTVLSGAAGASIKGMVTREQETWCATSLPA